MRALAYRLRAPSSLRVWACFVNSAFSSVFDSLYFLLHKFRHDAACVSVEKEYTVLRVQ